MVGPVTNKKKASARILKLKSDHPCINITPNKISGAAIASIIPAGCSLAKKLGILYMPTTPLNKKNVPSAKEITARISVIMISLPYLVVAVVHNEISQSLL